MRGLFDRFDVATNALADLIFLGGDPFAIGQQRLELAEVHGHIRAFKTTDHAADDVACAVFEFRVNQFLFRPADVLHQGLFGVLRCDASKVGRRHFDFHLLAELGVRFNASRVEQRNVIMF